MRKHLFPYIFLFFIAFIISPSAKADHSAGGELTYEHITGSQYRFTLKFYRDCSGIAAGPIMYMCCVNTCDSTIIYASLKKMATLPNGKPNGRIIDNGCPAYANTCKSTTATLPAYEEWWYDETVTLPGQCTDWTFIVAQSSRNPSNNISGVVDLVLMTTLNNMDAPGNSSPYFSVPPVSFVCINSPYTYNNGVVDPDGDSLEFLPQIPIASATCSNPVFSQVCLFSTKTPALGLPNNPFQTNNTYSLNSRSGNLTFTPTEVGPQTVSFIVREYRKGKLIGTVMRDIQIQVLNCNSAPISLDVDQSSIKNGNYNQGDIETCVDNELEFCFNVRSTDLTAILATSDNHTSSTPGATITYYNYGTNQVRGCVKWTPTAADSGLHILTISAKDSTCKAPGVAVTQTFTIPIFVQFTPLPVVTTPVYLCEDQQASPLIAKGTNLLWYEAPSGGLGSNTAPTPSTTTVGTKLYYVTQELKGCVSARQPIAVEVKEGPKFNLTISKDSVCWYEDVMIYNNIANTTNFAKSWNIDSGKYVAGTTTDTIIVDWRSSGIKHVTLTMANNVCYVKDTIDVYLKPTPVSFVEMNNYGCIGQEVTLSPYKNDAPTNYYWQVDEQTIYDSGYIATYKFKWNSLGPKKVTLYTEGLNGCKGNTFDTIINIHEPPVADISGPAFDDICYGKEFTLSTPEGQRYRYSWTPALAFTSFSKNTATATAEQSGYLHLTVYNLWDCTATDSFYVDASPCCEVIMPDAFTPNADGTNDNYRPVKASNHTIVSFVIFNRWGQIVYRSRDISKGWDGTFKGTPQDMGTYNYILEYLCEGVKEKTKKGNFILIR